MSKKIVYVVLGLLVVVNIYARGLKQESTMNGKNLDSSKNFVMTKTKEIFEYTNNYTDSIKSIDGLTEISKQNTTLVMKKMLKNI